LSSRDAPAALAEDVLDEYAQFLLDLIERIGVAGQLRTARPPRGSAW